MGQFFTFLSLSGLLDSSMVVFVSDHGEHLGEHDLWEHYEGAYETVARVPLVIRYPPKFPPGTRVSRVVECTDLFPTILSICEVPVASPLLLPLRDLSDLAHADQWPEYGVTDFLDGVEKYDRYIDLDRDPEPRPSLGLRRRGLKYLQLPKGRQSLFDLATDPRELNDLWDSKPEKVKGLAAEAADWVRVSRGRALSATRPAPALSPDHLRNLRDLGYLQGASTSRPAAAPTTAAREQPRPPRQLKKNPFPP